MASSLPRRHVAAGSVKHAANTITEPSGARPRRLFRVIIHSEGFVPLVSAVLE